MAFSRIDNMTVGDLKAVNAVLAKYHLSLESLMGETSKAPKAAKAAKTAGKSGKRGKAQTMYRGKGKDEAWSGRGAIAKWLTAKMDAGQNPNKFLVPGKQHSAAVLAYWENRGKPAVAKKAGPKKKTGKKSAKKKATKKAAKK